MGFDARHYGLLVYGLRKMRGVKRAQELADSMTAMGVKTTERTIWAIERGEQIPSLDRHLAIVKILDPKEGYFDDVFTEGPDD